MHDRNQRPLALVTGASSGIGYHLARIAAERGHDLVIAADRPIDQAVNDFQSLGATVDALQVELASREGIDELLTALRGRPLDVAIANAGHGLGGGFLEQDFSAVQHVIDTNITGTIYLLQRVARLMQAQRSGRILVTGSIAGYMPGAFQAVYNGSKAFIDSFVAALRNEMKDVEGVSITCLMPGVTDTEFFARADMLDTKLGSDTAAMMDPAKVAESGFKAMLAGEADVVAGLKNKAQVALSKVLPSQLAAEHHRRQAEPGTAND
ncbi:MAG TPA: SDR family NAD(P)-dependent oxidoreductase [Rubrivivax sp.]|nr:SDR family NAD(P)-dependent oxidoreductase [Rubrivivax sp.]